MVKIVFSKEEANCITHSGTMHADEVFATAFLSLYLEKELRVYRTNSVNLDEVDDKIYVYDIGRGMYDHHQPDALKRENDITYSSFISSISDALYTNPLYLSKLNTLATK